MNARSGIEACIVSLIDGELEEGGELREKILHIVQLSLEREAAGGMMEAVTEEVRARVERVNIERIVRMVAKDLDFENVIKAILIEQEVLFASVPNEARLAALENRVADLMSDARPEEPFGFDALAAVDRINRLEDRVGDLTKSTKDFASAQFRVVKVLEQKVSDVSTIRGVLLNSLDERVARETAQLWEAIREIKGSGIDMPLPVESPPPPAASLKRYKVAIREVHDSVRFVDAENEEQAGQIASGTEEHHLQYVRTMDNVPPRAIEWGGPELDSQFPPVVRVGKQ